MPADTMQAAFGDRSAAEESQVRPTRDGKIYCSGTSPFGAMGLNVAGARCAEPRLVTTLVDKQICQISCGWRHTLLVDSGGQAYSCGDGSNGKLGLGDELNATIPRLVGGLGAAKIAQVSCGQHHSGLVAETGSVFTFGLGLYGQLGHGDLTNQLSPRRIAGITDGLQISCGDMHTLLLRKDGRASAFGFAANGRLGLPASTIRMANAKPGAARSVDDRPIGEGEAICVEAPLALPNHAPLVAVSDAFTVIAVSAGGAHTALVYADGGAYTFGRGDFGQLGHGAKADEILPRKVRAALAPAPAASLCTE